MIKSRVSERPRLREEGENRWCDAATDQVIVLERLADGQKGTEGKSHKRDIDRLSAMYFVQVSSMFAYMFDESDKTHHGKTSEVDAAALLEFARQHKKRSHWCPNEGACTDDNFVSVLHNGSSEFEKTFGDVKLDAPSLVEQLLKLHAEKDKAVCHAGSTNARNTIHFDGGFGSQTNDVDREE